MSPGSAQQFVLESANACLCSPHSGPCEVNGVATASMDMGDFFYYTMPQGSWLYFTGTLQVLPCTADADHRFPCRMLRLHTQPLEPTPACTPILSLALTPASL